MSHKILIGAAVVAVVVLGFAWVSMGGSGIPAAPADTTASSSTPAGATGNTDTTIAENYTLAQVATHNNASSCWAAINGKVYNLTSWINQHPGGPERILSICGKDGSALFNGQHSGEARPETMLAGFYLGPLAQ